MPFSNPIVGGGGSLVYPSIHSPDYVAGSAGWSIMKNGSAQFSNLDLIGGLLQLFNTNDQILMYSGPPAANNLIFSLSNVQTTDAFGNNIPPGIQLGTALTNQLILNPNLNSQVNLTSTIFGILQAAIELQTTDSNESIAGLIGSAIFGSGTTANMATLISSPFAGVGSLVLVMAQNDGGTDQASIVLCSITTPDNSTIQISPMALFNPLGFAVYGNGTSTAFTIVTKTSGSGNISIPSNAASTGKAECWGGGVGGHCGIIFPGNGNGGEYGGSGGEYAANNAMPITPGGTVAYSVGAGSAGTVPGGGTPGNAGNSTLGTVTGHGGTITGNLPIGGTGSTDPIHFNGGNGGTNSQVDIPPPDRDNGGSGGGSSAGTGAHGNNGNNTSGNSGANGATAPSGGGNGGKGGSFGTNGAVGKAPGGGGGGGWANTGGANNGGNGANGQVRLTYATTTAIPTLFTLASASFTDPFGNTIQAGSNWLTPGGIPLKLTGSSSDQTSFTVTATAFTQFSKAWSIPANDAVVGSTYRIRVPYSGTQGSTAQTLALAIALSGTNWGGTGVPATFAGVSATFAGWFEAEIVCTTAGASGVMKLSKIMVAGNAVATNDSGRDGTIAFNTTIANTFEAVASWGSTTGAPTCTSRGSTFTKVC